MIRVSDQNHAPRVTIGMPAYNASRFIREALDSLLQQTFTDFELVISDNASTDETGDICLEYARRDRRIRYIRQPCNIGAASNFLFVVKQALGSYFMWAATDDRWDARWLEILEREMKPGVSLSFGSVRRFQDGNSVAWEGTMRSLMGSVAVRMLTYFLWNNAQSGKSDAIYGLYRTDQILHVAREIFESDGDRWGSDNILVFTMLQYGGLHIEPGVYFSKRTRPLIGVQSITAAMVTKWRKLGPFILEHIRRAPPGFPRLAIIAATPIKYAWQIWRAVRRVTILTFNMLIGKDQVVGKI